MKSLDDIRAQLAHGQFEFTQHALKRVVERNISHAEICEAGGRAVMIEDYPTDKYSPSCLILGFTLQQRPLHIQVSRAEQPKVKIITLYEPDPNEWTDFTQRKP